jgi:hypothetical protein
MIPRSTRLQHARAALALAAAVSIAACTGCGRDVATPVATAPPAPVPTDKQAIEAATANERLYQDALAKGNLAFLAACAPGSPESVRLVEMADDDSQGYSLAITADTRGAVAIWQGINHVGGVKYQAFGPQGMRLDGNGWRQIRQLLGDPAFAEHARPDMPGSARSASRAFVVSCLDGERRMVDRFGGADASSEYERAVVTMRRLAGNAYSPPGTRQQ